MKIIRCLNAKAQPIFAALQDDGNALRIEGDVFGKFAVSDEPVTVSKLLTPVEPCNIIGIGLNYRRHAEESKAHVPQYPVIFMKPTSAVQNPEDPILLPRHLRSREVDYECELAVVIKRVCKNVARDNALDYVLGYTCANDVSARDWQLQWGGSQWCRGKSFDTFAPLGPWLVTSDEIPNPNALAIKLDINGEVLQDWHTSDMIFDIAALIEFLSGSTTLLPGTVILTGTPHGVGVARKPARFLQAGDIATVTIEKIGQLRNPVREEAVN